MNDARNDAMARKSRHIGLVIAITAALWIGLGMALGPAMGLPGRYAILIDLAALAGFVYALVNIYQLWRMRQED